MPADRKIPGFCRKKWRLPPCKERENWSIICLQLYRTTQRTDQIMSYTKIAKIFADSEALSGQTVTVGGWVRTIRDLKGFGFIELNDGSCFRNLQVVMEAEALDNYKDIAAQNVGAALIVTGVVTLTPDAKQPLELKAAEIAVEGVVLPGLSPAEKAPQRGVPADNPAPASPDEPVLRDLPGAERGGLCHPQVLPGAGLCLCPDPHHHRQRLRGRRRDVPGDHAGSRTTCPRPRTVRWTTARTSSARRPA